MEGRSLQKTVALTMGDRYGVGPELVARLLADWPASKVVTPILFGDPEVFARGCAVAQVAPKLRRVASPADARGGAGPTFVELPFDAPVGPPGHASAAAGGEVLATLERVIAPPATSTHSSMRRSTSRRCATPGTTAATRPRSSPAASAARRARSTCSARSGPRASPRMCRSPASGAGHPARDRQGHRADARVPPGPRRRRAAAGGGGAEPACRRGRRLRPRGDRRHRPGDRCRARRRHGGRGAFPGRQRVPPGPQGRLPRRRHDVPRPGTDRAEAAGPRPRRHGDRGLPIPITTAGHGTAFDIAGKGIATVDGLAAAAGVCRRMLELAAEAGSPAVIPR